MIISYLPRSLALLLEGLKLKALGEDGEEEDAHDGEEESDWLLVDAALREVVGDFEVFLAWGAYEVIDRVGGLAVEVQVSL